MAAIHVVMTFYSRAFDWLHAGRGQSRSRRAANSKETATLATVTKRVAKSANRTADGRPLPRVWLEQAAASYKPETYTARVFLEHIRSYYPDSPFKVYGSVSKLSTEAAPHGELYLLADIETTAELDAMWDKGQKRAFSIEIDPDFADVGGAYMVGLAVTDDPASLGTHFTQKFCYDPQRSTTEEFTMPADNTATTAVPDAQTTTTETPATPAAPAAELPAIPEHFSSTLQHFSAELSALRTERDTLKAELATNATNYASQLAAKDAKIETLKQQIPAEGYKARPMATGNEDGKRILF